LPQTSIANSNVQSLKFAEYMRPYSITYAPFSLRQKLK